MHRSNMTTKEVHKTKITNLVTEPPEKAKWVAVQGTVLVGSEFVEVNQNYAVFWEPESRMGLYVLHSKDSLARYSSFSKNSEVTLRGMVQVRNGDKPFPRKNVPQDVRLGNLIFSVDETPPTWLSAELLMILGFIFLGGGDPRKD